MFDQIEVKIEIVPSIRPSLPSILASAIVTLELACGPLKICDCRILQNKNGVYWFSFPTFSVPTSGRQFEYRQTLEIPAELAQRISALAIEEFIAWQKAQNGGSR